jgi:hypothetical protein
MRYLSFLFILIGLVSCESEKSLVNKALNEDLSDLRSVISAGDIHNDFMDLANAHDFSSLGSILSYGNVLDYLVDFYQTNTNNYSAITSNDKLIFEDLFENHINLTNPLYCERIIRNVDLVDNPFQLSGQSTLSQLKYDLFLHNGVTQAEYNQLIGIQNALVDVYDFEMGISELVTYLESINDASSYILKSVKDIGLRSSEWWKGNEVGGYVYFLDDIIHSDHPDYYPNGVAALVANDIAGAVFGGCLAVGGQLIFNDEVNWGMVGYSMVGAAVIASTGAVGRLASWIRKWY